MKITICFLILLFAVNVFGQKIITTPTQDETIFIPNVTVIPDKEWSVMIDYLKSEKWDSAAFYASGLLRRLKDDNDKKQIAQLRYFYLFSLAGKILKSHDAGKTAEKESAWLELEKVFEDNCAVCHQISTQWGKDFGPDLSSIRNQSKRDRKSVV